MPKGAAARVGDMVNHQAPPKLTPSNGMGSPNVFIGKLPAWRGVGAAVVPGLQAAKQAADTAIQIAEAATTASTGTPGFPAAKAAEESTKASVALSMGSTVMGTAAAGGDIHMCTQPLPLPPHGAGVVIDGSTTVRINGLPACRKGDTIVEAVGPPNQIASGEDSVIIGG